MSRKKNTRKKLHVKKGDLVMLTKAITASKALNADRPKGYTGKILKVFPQRERIIVEGVNMRFRHVRPNQMYPDGGRIEQEMPIHASNVMPVDANGNATRIGRKQIEDEFGKTHWVRFAKTTGEELD